MGWNDFSLPARGERSTSVSSIGSALSGFAGQNPHESAVATLISSDPGQNDSRLVALAENALSGLTEVTNGTAIYVQRVNDCKRRC